MPTAKKKSAAKKKAAKKKTVVKKKAAKKVAKKTSAAKKAAAKAARWELIYAMAMSKVYPMYVTKVEGKGRTKKELDQVLCWLTGYTNSALKAQIKKTDLRTFIEEAEFHPNTHMITGTICGYRVEEITEPLMQKIRYIDKLVDELARGRAMEKILRA